LPWIKLRLDLGTAYLSDLAKLKFGLDLENPLPLH